MASVGLRLSRERESRDMTVEDMAAATGIGQSYLEALERDEIEVLPGPAFGKLYIRAYAEVLGFDAQPWIDDYDRAQRMAQGASPGPAPAEPSRPRPVAEAIARWKAERVPPEALEEPGEDVADPPVEPAVEAIASPPVPVPEPAPTPTARRRVAPLWAVGAIGIVIVGAIYIGTRRPAGDRPPVTPAPDSAPIEAPTIQAPPVQPPPVEPPPARTKPAVESPVPTSQLTVSESGLGRRIVNLRLEGEGDRFEQGDRVCFATRVIGGRSGGVIRHVWLREGKVEQSIPLRLGGSDWRTHSNKTLGREGAWTVEARDASGRVLASASFSCVARSR